VRGVGSFSLLNCDDGSYGSVEGKGERGILDKKFVSGDFLQKGEMESRRTREMGMVHNAAMSERRRAEEGRMDVRVVKRR